MRIVINTCFLGASQRTHYAYGFLEPYRLLAQRQTADEFIFLVAEEDGRPCLDASSITTVVMGPMPKNIMQLKWWYDVKLPSILQKMGADVLVCPDGCCGPNVKIPQLAVVPDTVLEKKPSLFYTKNFMQKSLHKAAVVATGTAYVKEAFVKEYGLPSDHFEIVNMFGNGLCRPLEWEEKEKVKHRYSSGKEFFLYWGTMADDAELVVLLKAFSLFKKRQQSNMQLLLLPANGLVDKAFAKKLETYKYKSEVIVLDEVEPAELAQITAASYAFVYPFAHGNDAPFLVAALQSGLPLIVSRQGVLPEIAGNAALYVDPSLPESIAEQMKTIYKDENQRSILVANAKEIATDLDVQKAANKLWVLMQRISKR